MTQREIDRERSKGKDVKGRISFDISQIQFNLPHWNLLNIFTQKCYIISNFIARVGGYLPSTREWSIIHFLEKHSSGLVTTVL